MDAILNTNLTIFFNYTRNHTFVNVCGKHESQTGAFEDQKMKEKLSIQRDIIENARDILINHIDSDKVIHQLRVNNVLSKAVQDKLLHITSKYSRAHELLNHLFKLEYECLIQLRLALIKAGHSTLVKYLRTEKKTTIFVTAMTEDACHTLVTNVTWLPKIIRMESIYILGIMRKKGMVNIQKGNNTKSVQMADTGKI